MGHRAASNSGSAGIHHFNAVLAAEDSRTAALRFTAANREQNAATKPKKPSPTHSAGPVAATTSG